MYSGEVEDDGVDEVAVALMSSLAAEVDDDDDEVADIVVETEVMLLLESPVVVDTDQNPLPPPAEFR